MSIGKHVHVVLFLMGMIVFSPFSSTISMDILHLPISAPELLIMFFLPFILKRYRFSSLKRKGTIGLLLCWLFLIAVGIFVNRYPIYAILSTARGYLYLFLFYLLFSKPNNFQITDGYYVCVGSLIGWLLTTIMSYRLIVLNDEQAVSYGPMLILPIIIGYNGIHRHFKKILLFVIVGILIGVMGAVRRELLILLLSVVLLCIYYGIRNKRMFIRLLFFISIVTGMFISNIDAIGDALRKESYFLYQRIFQKTEKMLTGEENEGDELRKELMWSFVEKIPESILPKGFVSKQTQSDPSAGTYNDVPLLELEYTFSVLGALGIILYFGYASYLIYHKVRRGGLDNENFIFVGAYITVVILLFLEGSYLSYPYSVPITGYVLGNIQYKSSLKLKMMRRYNTELIK